MKTLYLSLVFSVVFAGVSFSQSTDPRPGSAIPPFKMLMTNNKYFSDQEVQKNKPFVLVYFAPDCDHCIKLMDELFKKIHEFDKATVVLVTFKPVRDLLWFEEKYHTPKYPNIKVGTEGISYVLRNFYRLDKTPFTAVYDKKGKLAFSYKDETPVGEFVNRFRKL
jgi:thiol-disulfide isomerase/thioredoxin